MTGRRPGWLLDEVASAGRENLDGEHVLRYDVKEDAGAAAEVDLLRSWGLDAVEAEWSRAELEEHVRDEHSTYTWLLEPMLERTGFVIEDAAYEDGIVARYVARAL